MKEIVVQKFGGTSVANLERISKIGSIIAAAKNCGLFPVVVVSAMHGTTNDLLKLAQDAGCGAYCAEALQEHDAILASGEQVCAGLVALKLQSLGLRARSYLSWQLPIKTDATYGDAKIISVAQDAIYEAVSQNEIPIIAGFQGIDNASRITTLGRGGSDTTAAAIAAAVGATRCDIYTDVEGVFTADPRIVTKAKILDRISYPEMLELASLGAKVLHPRSVEIAMKYNVPLRVLSSFTDTEGTMLITENTPIEGRVVTAITHSAECVRISILGIPLTTGSAMMFNLFAEHGIDVEMFSQNISKNQDCLDVAMVLKKQIAQKVHALLEGYKELIGYSHIGMRDDLVIISVVGIGVKSHSNVTKDVLNTLSNKGIRVDMLSMSEIKISAAINAEYAELAMRALHSSFGLDKE